ncbi:MAG: hypothetical protein ACRD47_12320, partial [Nitrososphaeraceae archaeon]
MKDFPASKRPVTSLVTLHIFIFWVWFGFGQDAGCERKVGRALKEVEGVVGYGETFSETFGDRFIFKLKPINTGWMIQVIDTKHDVDISRLTPPLHGPNPTMIEGWHFRNEANTGPNEGELNVPQRIRRFNFSPGVRKLLNVDRISPEQLTDISKFGRGELKILDYGLADLRPRQQARMVWMRFKVCLS